MWRSKWIIHVSFSLFVPPFFPRVDKKRDKIERKILDSQERAFWDVHRPVVSEITDDVVIVTFDVSDIVGCVISTIFYLPLQKWTTLKK